jgi:hypothetical protein
MMLLDSRKYRLREPKLVDLSEVEPDPEKGPLAIARSLEPGAHDIDLSQLEI